MTLPPAVTVSQLVALLTAVQLQPAPAVTVTVLLGAADDVRFEEVGVIVNVHGAAAWVTVKVCPAIVMVPVRDEVLFELAVERVRRDHRRLGHPVTLDDRMPGACCELGVRRRQ